MEDKELDIPTLIIKDGNIYLDNYKLGLYKNFKIEKNKAGITEFTPTLYVELKNLDCF